MQCQRGAAAQVRHHQGEVEFARFGHAGLEMGFMARLRIR